MATMLHRAGILLLVLASCALAQTEYESTREPAMQRLGTQLQSGDVDGARHDLAGYLDRFPGDAVMQYNLACLDAVAGDTDGALVRLGAALDAGYRDLERPLHDPDLVILADDPRLAAMLDATRAGLVADMQGAEIFLEEGPWSEPRLLVPDPFGPGEHAETGTLRVRHDIDSLTLEIVLPPAGADEAIVVVALPRSLEDHETRRWFEFRAPLNAPGPLTRTGRHGRQDAAADVGEVTVDGEAWTVCLPWSSLHPYRPPVELVLGLEVALRRDTGAVPAQRWALIGDPHAASAVVPWRRFAPLILDPGPQPTPLVAGRLETYLVVGDSLTVELGIQGLPGGEVRVSQLVNDRPDTSFTTQLEPEFAYLTLDYRLPAEPPSGWFELGAAITDTAGVEFVWNDRGFRLQPDWFITQNERLAGLREPERPIVQYELMRTLRGQQGFQPHDDPTTIAEAALRAVALLDRAEATGTVLPETAGGVAAAFPLGDDALQACQLVLPATGQRGSGPLLVVVTAAREAAATIAKVLAADRAAADPRAFVVLPVRVVPGRADLAAATVLDAAMWARALIAPTEIRFVGAPGAERIAAQASLLANTTPVPTLLLGPEARDVTADHAIRANVANDDPATWVAAILAWD